VFETRTGSEWLKTKDQVKKRIDLLKEDAMVKFVVATGAAVGSGVLLVNAIAIMPETAFIDKFGSHGAIIDLMFKLSKMAMAGGSLAEIMVGVGYGISGGVNLAEANSLKILLAAGLIGTESDTKEK
jgi:hypothetical protein